MRFFLSFSFFRFRFGWFSENRIAFDRTTTKRSEKVNAKMVKKTKCNNKVFAITLGQNVLWIYRCVCVSKVWVCVCVFICVFTLWSSQLSFYERITRYFHIFGWLTSHLWFNRSILSAFIFRHVNVKIVIIFIEWWGQKSWERRNVKEKKCFTVLVVD